MSEKPNGTAVAERQLPPPGDFSNAPVVVRMDRQKYDLIQRTVAKDATPAELGLFLELASKYELDPFAKEVWCVKGSSQDGGSGRLLIMVGRDGLRKIAMRNGLRIDGDVVRENDEFTVHRDPDRKRTIDHAYREAAEAARTDRTTTRGPIVGAWAEVWDEETGEQRGYFYADLIEYRPTNAKKLQYSPWGSQESVMILAAAERQALRQATPLSGLLVEGEMDRNDERMAGMAAADPDAPDVIERAIREVVSEDWAQKLIPLVLEINGLRPNTWLPSAIQMQLGGQEDDVLDRFFAELSGSVEELRVENEARLEGAEDDEDDATDAVVVEPQSAVEDAADGEPSAEDLEAVEVLRSRERALLAGEPEGEQQIADREAELEQVREGIRKLGFTPESDVEE